MSCINVNLIKPIANKYGVSTEDILSATYLYQLKYNTEEFNENDPQYDEFIKDFFKIDKNIDVENEEQFEKLLNAWNNYTTNGITRIKNKESKDSIISFLATAFGEGNIATYSDNDGNMFVRIAQPILAKSKNIFYNKENDINPYGKPRFYKKQIVLSEKTSQRFESYLKKSRNNYPKTFYDEENKFTYIKSNNKKNSRKYDVINTETGEIVAQGKPIYTQEEFKDFLEKRKSIEREFKNYSEKRSFAFKKGLQIPSKGLFKRMAKQYLMDAIKVMEDEEGSRINMDIIDNYINQFPESFWERVVTYLLSPTWGWDKDGKPLPPRRGVFGLTYHETERINRDELERWSFNFTIPKSGLIQKVEEYLGKKIEGTEVFGKIGKNFYNPQKGKGTGIKISTKTKYSDLVNALLNLIEKESSYSYEDRLKAYAEANNYTLEEVKEFVENTHNLAETGDSDLIDSQIVQRIEEYNPARNLITKIQNDYNEKYLKYLIDFNAKNPDKIVLDTVNIIFNRDSFVKNGTPIVRLATIMHEPWHALEILHKGEKVHEDVINALNVFKHTKYGKEIIDSYYGRNVSYDVNDLDNEFLADLFSIMMMPEQLRRDYALSEAPVLGVNLANLLHNLLSKSEVISYLKDETEIIEEEKLVTYTEEEKIILPLLKRIYNAIVKWLSEYSDFIKNTLSLVEETKLVEKQKIEKIRRPITTTKEIQEVDESLKEVKDALNILYNYMQDLMHTEVSKDNILEDENTNEHENKIQNLTTDQQIENIKQYCIDTFKSEEVKDDKGNTKHVYSLKDDPNVKSEASASTLTLNADNKFVTTDKVIPKQPYGLASTTLGSTIDTLVRDFFSGDVKKSYPNLTDDQVINLKNQLKAVQLWAANNGNYTITNANFPMLAEMTVNGKKMLVGGEMDLIAYNDKGDIMIIDIKNKRANATKTQAERLGRTEKDLEDEYKAQQNAYKIMFESITGLKVKNLKILQFKCKYPAGFHEKLNPSGKHTWTTDSNKQLYYGETKLQDLSETEFANDYSAPELVLYDEKTGIKESTNTNKDGIYTVSNIDVLNTIVEEVAKETKEFGDTEKVKRDLKNTANNENKVEYKVNKIDEQTSNLRESGIKNTDLHKLACNVINALSDIYDNINKSSGLYCKVFNIDYNKLTEEEKKEVKRKFESIKELDREDLFKQIPVSQVLNYIKEAFFNPALYNEDNENYNTFLSCYNNFDALVRLGYSRMILLEKRTLNKEAIDFEDIRQDGIQDDFKADTEEVSNKDLEHWMIEQASVKSSLSGEWRRIIAKTRKVDKENKQIYDKFGFPEFVDENVAINNLLNWFRECTTLQQMLDVLDQKIKYYPEYAAIRNVLNDDEQLKSKFFQNFRKDFQQYSIVIVNIDDDGVRTATIKNINLCSATEYMLSNLGYKFAVGFDFIKDVKNEKAIFNETYKKAIKDGKEITITERSVNKGRISEIKSILSTFSREAENLNEKNIDEITKKFEDILSIFGIVFPENTVKQALEAELNNKTNTSFSKTLVSDVISELGYMLTQKIEKLKPHEPYSIFKEGPKIGEISIRENYVKILRKFEPFLENVVEASSYENGKMHYAFNPPSYTGKMMIKFKQAVSNPTEFDNFLKNEYCKYYFVTDENVSRAKDAQFLCPILKMMNEYEANQIGAKTLTTNAINARKWFEHKIQLSYNKTAYTELGGLTYMHSILSEFFVSNDSDNDIVKAFYRMPIEANKPAFEFLSMPRFKGSNYKKALGKYYFDVFTQELMRIRTVLERACSVDSNGKSNLEEIKNYDITKKQKESTEVKAILEKFKNKQSLAWKDLKVLSNTGASFKFLSFLNNLDVNTDNSKSNLQKYILDFIKYDVDVNSISAASNDFQNVLEDSMKTIVKNQIDYFDKLGLFEQAKTYDKYVHGEKIEGKPYYKYFTFLKLSLNTSLEEQRGKIDEQLENFVWNDMLAAINTIELTATDLAYYKNMEDFQKRFAQIHAPGLRLNTAAQAMLYDGTKDDSGKSKKVMQPVSDGKSRTMYIKDDEKESTGIEKKVVTAFNKLIESQIKEHPERADSLRTMRDVVKAALKKVNVADAQAYTSPTGMMKKLTMAGSWTNDMTKAYYKICSGNFNLNDLKVLIQPLKPFVYSQIDKHSYAKTLKTLKVGLQNKNSEYMILLADAIMRGASVDNKLMALFDFMEGSAYNGRQVVRNGKLYTYNRTKTGVEVTIKDAEVGQKDGTIVTIGEYKNDGIDTIQFESAVKVGSEGIINLNNKDYDGIIKELASKTQSAIGDNYDDRYVHTFNYEDYAVQQEVPAHFKDHRQLLGSQERILNVSDMPLDTQMYFTTYNNEQLTTAGGIAKRYQQLLADNIKDSFDELAEVLGLNILDKYERNRKLSELLIQEMQKDARYGADLQIACMINKETGEFNIPLSDPIQATRIQQLIHSIIKSRINKQKIAGGPVVQTSCWGMAERFNIVWKDSSGNTITLKSFKKNNKDELVNLTEDEIQEKFEKYIESNAATLAHFECAAPVPTKELEKDLIKLAKKLDGDNYNGRLATPQEAVVNGLITEEQLQAIGYRIPTEDKYSMYPMVIKEWVPRAAGEVIILPEEITKLTGSDFDIDKTYIIAPEFKRTSITRVKEDSLNIVAKIVANKLSSIKDEVEKDASVDIETAKSLIHNWEIDNSKSPLVDSILKSQPKNIFEETDVTYVKIKEVVKNQDENNSKTVRNNEIFDIQWKMLTHQNTVDKMFNPGSFDVQKRTALMVQILKSPNVDKNEDYGSLNKLSLEQLEDKLKELNAANDNNICYISTQVKFFQQNMTAGKLIGIFANNNVSHAFIQLQNEDEYDSEKSIKMNFDPELNLSFDGIPLGTDMVLDRIHALDGKTYISKNIAGFLAASVDAVKDPVLNHLNLNTFTSGVAMVLARLGFDVDSIGLFLSQPILVEAASMFANKNNEGYATASEIIEELLRDLDENGQLTDLDKQVAGNELTKEKMSKNLIDNNRSYNKEVLRFFYNLLPYTQALGDLTFLTKFNSMSNAAGPTIADNIIMTKRHTRFEGLFDSQRQIKIFNKRTRAILDKNNSPLLNAFYKYTVAPDGAVEQAFKPWFIQYSKTFGRILKRWEETTKAPIDEKTINQLVFDFMLYKLTSGDNPFFDTSIKNRKRFIYNFPNEFFETLNKYPELENNELIKVINLKTETKTCPIRTLEVNSGGFAADTQENIKNAWSDLLSSDNADIQKLGKDLFFYCLYRNGFGFSPKTFIHLASVDVKLGMGYTTLIETMVDEMANNSDEEIDIDEFIEQFKRNRHDNYKAVSRFKLKDLKKNDSLDVHKWESELTIKKSSENKNGFSQFLTDDNKIVPIIKVDKQLYKINLSMSSVESTLTYEPISPLGNTNNFLEYQAPSGNKANGGKITSVINEEVDEETPVEQDGGFTSNTPGKEADAGKTQPNVNSESLNGANNSNSANETANAVGATDSEKTKAKDIQSDQC